MARPPRSGGGRARTLLILGLVALAAVGAALPAATDAAVTRTVRLVDVAIKPATVTVQRGDRVRWTWGDRYSPHTVTPRGSKRFKGAGARVAGEPDHVVRFRRAGTYRYVCTIHPGMRGRVVVRP